MPGENNKFTLEKQADAMLDGATLLALIDEIHKALGPTPTAEQVQKWLEMKKQ